MAIFSNGVKQSAGGEPPRGGAAPGLTIVASGTQIVGDVIAAGVIKVEGEVRGMVRTTSQVLIAKGGVINGDVLTREAVIGGEIHGSIKAEERVEIQPGAVVDGDILTQRILIADGGRVNGQISMESGISTSDTDASPEERFAPRPSLERVKQLDS